MLTDSQPQAGDPVEFESLASVFGNGRTPSNPLIVSSVKGNIGHAEAASGGAGLAKLLAMMAHGQAPPQVGLKVLNPKIASIQGDGIVIPRELLKWPRRNGMPRRALLNNFGAAGSNACLVLEEYQERARDTSHHTDRASYVFILSAKDDITLERYRESVLQDPSLWQRRLRDIAYTSTRRAMLEYRLVVEASSTEQLWTSISSARIAPPKPHQSTVFVFSGQGSQYLGMGSELFATVPQFRDDILQCNLVLVQAGHCSILPLIQRQDTGTGSLDDHGILETHCAVFAVEYALARLWISWGVRPDAVFGHSLGEYAAFVVANVLTMEDAISIIARRAVVIEEMCEHGASTMLSVNAGASYVQNFITSNASTQDLSIACDNSPRHCVVSGPTSQITDLKVAIATTGIRSKRLDVSFGYHSQAIQDIRASLNEFVARVPLREPRIPLGLGLHGRMHRAHDIDSKYFASQAIQPVRFRETVEDYMAGATPENTLYLEIGPHPTVLPMLRAMPQSPATAYLASLYRDKPCWSSMCMSVAELVRCGLTLDFETFYKGQDVRLIDLPLYPFSKEQFRIPYTSREPPAASEAEKLPGHTRGVTGSPLLACRLVQHPEVGGRAVYEVSSRIEELIQGHRVSGQALCPASVYVELALQAARDAGETQGGEHRITVKDVIFASPLIGQHKEAEPQPKAQVEISRTGQSPSRISFSVYSNRDGRKQTHCEGLLHDSPEEQEHMGGTETTSLRFRGTQRPSQLIKRKMLYETIFSRVVTYSEPYRTIDYLELSDDSKSAWGSFRLRHPAVLANGVSQPVFVDTLLHAAGFLANCSVDVSEVCICTKIESIDINALIADYTESFRIYTEISITKSTVVGNSYAYDGSGALAGRVGGIVFRRLSRDTFTRSLNAGKRVAPLHEPPQGVLEGAMGHYEDRYFDTVPSLKVRSTNTATSIANGTNGINGINGTNGHHGTNAHAQSVTGESTAGPSMTVQIGKAVAEVVGLPEDRVHGGSDIQQLGLDSLMAFELVDMLRSRLGLEIAHSELESCRTPNDITRLVESSKQLPSHPNGSSQTIPSPLSVIQTGVHTAHPLYLIHDGSGLTSMYKAISTLGRGVLGISCDTTKRFPTLEDMALNYATLIDISKPFILGGEYLSSLGQRTCISD